MQSAQPRQPEVRPPLAADETPTSTPPEDKADPIAPGQIHADPLLRMTLVDLDFDSNSHASDHKDAALVQDGHDGLTERIDDLQSKPWRKESDVPGHGESDALDRAEAADYEEPAFVTQARRRQRFGRVLRMLMLAGSVVLLGILLAQSIYVFRDQIAVWFPQARPALAEACAFLDCQVGLPAHIDAVSIESSELQALPANGNAFALTLLLRNQSATAQTWPHIELALNDANENTIARRVFTPREYLPPGRDINAGFSPSSEQPLKLFFELAQLKASGYRVYLFYP
jgi:hypothetical protein